MACENCNPITMYKEGCCTGETGRAEGFGVIKVRGRNGEVYEACGRLVKYDDVSWGCSDYSSRPDICKSFECDASIRERIGDDGDNGIDFNKDDPDELYAH